MDKEVQQQHQQHHIYQHHIISDEPSPTAPPPLLFLEPAKLSATGVGDDTGDYLADQPPRQTAVKTTLSGIPAEFLERKEDSNYLEDKRGEEFLEDPEDDDQREDKEE